MIWTCFATIGSGHLAIIEFIINSPVYQSILVSNLWPSVQQIILLHFREFVLFSCFQIFLLTTCFQIRRLHILLSLPGADHGWDRRGGQACENAGTKNRCQLRFKCHLLVVGLCSCPALNKEEDSWCHWSYSMAAWLLYSFFNVERTGSWSRSSSTNQELVLIWKQLCGWLKTKCGVVLKKFSCQWKGPIHWLDHDVRSYTVAQSAPFTLIGAGNIR